MRNNHKAKKFAVRIAAMGLTVVMGISLIGTLSFDASAVVSLSGIEKIKNTGHLSILEIVPKANSGSIGYYVAGQEPTRGWYSQVAGIVGDEARSNYAKTLFENLQNRGLMSTDTAATYDAYPLAYKGPYVEYKPWNIPENVDFNALTVLKLGQAEEQNVKGEIQECGEGETGDYVLDNTYVFDTSSAAEYIENAAYYEYSQRLIDPSVETAYYYHVDFERIRLTDKVNPDPELGEVNVDEYLAAHPEVTLYTTDTASGLPYYVYAGTLKRVGGNFTIDDEINNGAGYFIAKPDYTTISTARTLVVPIEIPTVENGAGEFVVDPTFVGRTLYVVDDTVIDPTEVSYKAVVITADFNADPALNPQYYTQDQAHSYFANTVSAEPFRLAEGAEKPFFKKVEGYRYVGGGKGDYTFVYNPDGDVAENIEYDAVYVTGGYTNNEWFKRYVMDMDSGFDDFVITVNSVTPDGGQLTAAMVSSYDLVVISAGFDLASGNAIQYTADLRKESFDEILKKPRVVDTNLAVSSALSGNTYLGQLKNGRTASAVTAENVYYFANITMGDNTEVTRLVTNKFHTAIPGANSNNNAYKVVADEIMYENMLRDSSEALSTDISMASCIRYVVNTHRIINKKTALHVLDIQPAPRYDETGNSGPLTVETVLSWLPQSMQDQLAKKNADGTIQKDNTGKTIHDITITHMSTAALVGKIEDITEQYDLIYIGAAKSTTDLNYLDDRLGDNDNNTNDDYHYANIGAVQNTNNLVKGLLQTNDTRTRYSGNDLTPTKRDELVAFAQAKMPIVVAGELVTGDGTTEEREHSLTVDLRFDAATNKVVADFNLNPTIPAGDYTVTYQWTVEKRNYYPGGSNWGSAGLSDEELQQSAVPAMDECRYSCTVRVTPRNGTANSARSDRYLFTTDGASGQFTESKNWIASEKRPSQNYFNGEVSNSDAVNGTLSVRPTYTGSSTNYTATYQWYRGNRPSDGGSNGNPVFSGNNAQFNFRNDPNTKFYCVITVRYDSKNYYVTSPEYTWVPPVSSSTGALTKSDSNGTTGKVITTQVIGATGEIALDRSKVDPNSLMYDALNSVWNLEDVNILTESELIAGSRTEDNEKKLVNALNLSRPAINLSYQPAEYQENLATNGTVSGNNGGDLRFDFQIENITDPDPANTRYRCNLYIDMNGDGRHSEDELIPGTTIESIVNGTVKRVNNGALEADEDITYRVTRSLNSGQSEQFSGVVAWKLEVIKEAAAGATNAEKEAAKNVHASEKGYAYIQPTKRTELKILQIRSSYNKFTSNVDLSTPADTIGANGSRVDWETQSGNNSQFQQLYKQLYNAGMYHITVKTTRVNSLNFENGSSGTQRSRQSVFDELNQYDMIILGFEDCYGNFEMNAALAVTDYIATGKSLLFTHDTTSYWNNPSYSGSSSSRPGWGFWFNQVIRDKVGLDRYGATHTTYGKQVSTSGTATYGRVASGVDGQIDSSLASTLQAAGYTVAYVPGNVGVSARETQGYANSTIERNTDTNTGSNKTTEKVSQVNKGQITEYPYHLAEELTVKSTHNQYYQLNMNADDVVVWYCLGGSTYADEKNDATNAYYIYNRGNITYSGAGHSADLSADEAKLFVNTMIAAYRAGNSAPEVNFRTATDDPASALLFPVQTSNENGTLTTESLGSEQDMYFKIQDRNLTDDKTISVKLYYEVTSSTTGAVKADTLNIGTVDPNLYLKEVSMGTIYRTDTGSTASASALNSDVLYTTVIPSDVLSYVAGLQGDGKIYLVATTVIHSDAGDVPYKSFDDLTLKKLGLLRLE